MPTTQLSEGSTSPEMAVWPSGPKGHFRRGHEPELGPDWLGGLLRYTGDYRDFVPLRLVPRMIELTLAVATIAQRFRIELEPGHQVRPTASATLRPTGGIRAVVYRREEGRS